MAGCLSNPLKKQKKRMLCFLISYEENCPIVIMKADFPFFFSMVASKNSATLKKMTIGIDSMHLLTF